MSEFDRCGGLNLAPQGPLKQVYSDIDTGKIIGTLTVSDPMTFEGNVEESAAIFMRSLCLHGQSLHDEIARLKARIAELESQCDYSPTETHFD